jgi:predicted AAA+ superfamily ATPase
MSKKKYTFIDLFAGIGGFHTAMHSVGGKCVYASEWDKNARISYEANYKDIEPKLFLKDKEGKYIYFNEDINDAIPSEIPNFDIDRAINHGLLPPHYDAENPSLLMSAYLDVYLNEEIKAEALVRNQASFNRFLSIAAMTDGEMVNYNNIASDCGVSANTVKEYFSILEDTLVGYYLPAFAKTQKRRVVQAPKFYLFDVGLVNHLLHRGHLERGTKEYGHAFEHLIIQELIAYIGYSRNENVLTYWRTYTGIEVDAIIGNAKIAIEFKSTEDVQNKHLKGLRAFADEYPECRKIIVALDRISRTTDDGIEIMYVYDFLKQLWDGMLF